MPALSSLVDRIAGEGSAAWDTHFRAMREKAEGKDVIIMSVGDPDFSTPEPIVEAAVNSLRAGNTHYTPILGKPALRAAIAKEMMRVAGVGNYQVGADEIMVTAGTQNALFAASLTLIDEGDEVLVLDPMYVTYEATFRLAKGKLVRVPCPRETGFRPDVAALEAAVTDKSKAIVFATPNNPTGVVMTREELEAIADIAIRHDLWVISDEVYAAQTYENGHVSIAALPGMKERTVTASGLSKSQAMTGWRVGWINGPKELIRHCDNLGLTMLYGLPGFIQDAAVEALTDARPHIAEMLTIYRQRRNLVADLLSTSGAIDVLVPEAGMFVLVDVTRTGLSAEDFAARLYEEKGVSALGASAFGEPAAGCLRLSFTTGEEELKEGCSRILAFLAGLNTNPDDGRMPR